MIGKRRIFTYIRAQMKFLFERYPAYPRGAFNIAIAIGLAILSAIAFYYFVVLFIPNVSTEASAIFTISLGVTIFLIISVFQLVLPFALASYLKKKSWTVGSVIILTFLQTNLIVTAAYVLAIVTIPNFEHSEWGVFFVAAMASGTIWTLLITIPRYLYLKTRNKKIADSLNSSLPSPSTFTKNKSLQLHEQGKAVLNITSSQFLYLECEDLFVYAYHLSEGHIRKTLIRRHIDSIVKDWDSIPEVVHCHYEYMVNLQRVTSLYGNASGVFYNLDGTKFKVPLSRRYIKEMKKAIELLSKEGK